MAGTSKQIAHATPLELEAPQNSGPTTADHDKVQDLMLTAQDQYRAFATLFKGAGGILLCQGMQPQQRITDLFPKLLSHSEHMDIMNMVFCASADMHG